MKQNSAQNVSNCSECVKGRSRISGRKANLHANRLQTHAFNSALNDGKCAALSGKRVLATSQPTGIVWTPRSNHVYQANHATIYTSRDLFPMRRFLAIPGLFRVYFTLVDGLCDDALLCFVE